MARRVLDPVDRISEVLFGLIMALTFTGSLSAAESGRADVELMLTGAIGCNIAWGLVDAVMYLMSSVVERSRSLLTLKRVREAAESHADLVVLGARGKGLLKRMLVGSVSESVLRHAVCPVLVERRPQ